MFIFFFGVVRVVVRSEDIVLLRVYLVIVRLVLYYFLLVEVGAGISEGCGMG